MGYSKASTLVLELSPCLQAAQDLGEGIGALGDDKYILRWERIVELDRARVVFECPHIIVAHDEVLVCALDRQSIFVLHESRDKRDYRSEISIQCVFPVEHCLECVVMRCDGYDEDRSALVDRVYPKEEIVSQSS